MAFQIRLPCYVCNNALVPRAMARLLRDDNNIMISELAMERRDDAGGFPADINAETRICNNCNILILRDIQTLNNDPQCLRLNILRQTSSRTCFVCNGDNNIHRLSSECRVNIFGKKNIYVPIRYVCCTDHLDERGYLFENHLEALRYVNRPYVLKGPELQIFLNALREEINISAQRRFKDDKELSDEEFKAVSPISKEDFNDLYTNYCDRISVQGGSRNVSKKDLLCFLCKMRQGLSDEFLWVLFQYPSRQAASLAVSMVRQSLTMRFTRENIGFEAISRQEYIERHVTDFANHLYNTTPEDSRAIVYNDCTYLDIERSTCFKTLRQSYCTHKKKHLVKPSMLVAPDGYILDIQGPYFSNASNNDASILVSQLNDDLLGMQGWFQPRDIFILDRGYRDAIPRLEEMGIVTKMPPVLSPGQTQFSTEEANEARIVTKTRWIVEARNGHLKNIFKFFGHAISTSHVPNLNDFLLISGAILNKYYGPIQMPNCNVHLASTMLARVEYVNVVQARVEAEALRQRRPRWVSLTAAETPLFPRLDLQYLHSLTFGTYQVKLSPGYIQDSTLRQLRDLAAEDEYERVFEIDRNLNEPGFIRIKATSRFRNATIYYVWIAFNEEYDTNSEEDPILGYYCTCKTGARTLGTCGHVTAIIWFLGFARYEDVKYPSLRTLQTIINART